MSFPARRIRLAENLESDSMRTALAGLDCLAPAEPKSGSMTGEGEFLLGETDGVLDLRPPGEHQRPGIQAVFPCDRGGDGRNPLVRAFGKRVRRVDVLTAGLGADAYRLARAGFEVRSLERDRVVHALLMSGWKEALSERRVPSEVAQRLSFVFGEGAAAINAIEGLDRGVYIDPMYPPPKRKSAKPKRELQVLRAWLAGDPGRDEAQELVVRARARAARVVVKRPHHAEPLVPGATFELETKLVRFDVYVNPKCMAGPKDE